MRRAGWLWLLLLVGAAMAPLGWEITTWLESDNAFCVSCHLEPEIPLHRRKHLEFGRTPAVNLAARHHEARTGFLCIDCHGGTGFAGQLEIKWVSAVDAVRYLVGRFGEPTRMRHPLRDADCQKCHESYSPQRDDAFHALEAHNIEFAHRCVECHRSHPGGVQVELNFLDREGVLPICRNCHEEF